MYTMRAAASEVDWWAVRDLIVRTHGRQPPGWNWDVRHWDGNRFHGERYDLPVPVGLWFDDGTLVAAAHGEDGGDVEFQLDPDHRVLEDEMLEWAESCLASGGPLTRELRMVAWDYDSYRQGVLARARFEQQDAGWWMRSIELAGRRIEGPRLAPPYRLSTTSLDSRTDDAARMAVLLNASFGRSIHTAAEYLGFMTRSPSFSHELNLVAVAPDDTFAAHVGVTYDALNRFGIFEPVCTHPDHRRHGLAAALMREGLRRLQDLGAVSACVETGDAAPANALYRSMGFTAEYRGHWWRRSWHPARDG